MHEEALKGLPAAATHVSEIVSDASTQTFTTVAELFNFLKEKKNKGKNKGETVDGSKFCLLVSVVIRLRLEWKKNAVWKIDHQLFPVASASPAISLCNDALVQAQQSLRVVSRTLVLCCFF